MVLKSVLTLYMSNENLWFYHEFNDKLQFVYM